MIDTSQHTCDVVEVKLEPHDNADSLSIVRVGDFQCVVRTSDWKDGDLAVYIPPDSVVPDTEAFAFLNGHRRIKARKLRGEWSVGLLIPAPDGSNIGDDCMESLGIVHYEPEMKGDFTTGGDNVSPPPIHYPSKYDIINFRKYSRYFIEGETVVATEKIHGANGRFTCVDDEIFCGSRNHWMADTEKCLWWKALRNTPELEEFLRANQGVTVVGEVYGAVQSLKYGCTKGEIRFAAFDIFKQSKWLDFDEARALAPNIPWVPVLYIGGFDKEQLLDLAEQDSIVEGADHHREGIVVKTIPERWNTKIGRLQMKLVSNRYLEKS